VNVCTAAVEMLNQETQADLLPVTDSSTETDLPDMFVTNLSVCRVDVGQADVKVTSSASSQDARPGDGDVHVQVVTPIVDKVGNTVDKPSQLTDFASLSYLTVVVSDNQGNRCVLSGLSDLGAEVALANAAAISKLKPVEIGFVKIKGVIGESILVPLVRLYIASADHPTCVVSFVCAVCTDANSALTVTADVERKLMPQVNFEPRCNVVSFSDSDSDNIDVNNEVGVVDDVDKHGSQDKNDNQTGGDEKRILRDDSTFRVVDVTDGSVASDFKTSCLVGSVTDVPDHADAAKLRSKQLTDETLLGCFFAG